MFEKHVSYLVTKAGYLVFDARHQVRVSSELKKWSPEMVTKHVTSIGHLAIGYLELHRSSCVQHAVLKLGAKGCDA
ncbi:MAG: hypothetical protein NVS1B11_00840 [Terriglobales bacterium]